ncbi:unnamed protein product [Tuber aestivum]|uniref:Uncharacterized protein n=1 Tax=Tuber aestivum TaxID=59557 RepID=A0A292Q0P9_9PEZI|nr:unnamed protein product [Tuber aestivum]
MSEHTAKSRNLRPLLLHDMHPHWGLARRLYTAFLSNTESTKYQQLQELESLRTIVDFLDRPDAFVKHVHRFAAPLMYKLCYEKRVVTGEESEVVEIDQMLMKFVQAGEHGRWTVEAFPILEWLPKRFAGWKREGEQEAKKSEGDSWVKKVQGTILRKHYSGTTLRGRNGHIIRNPRNLLFDCLKVPSFIPKAHATLDEICPDRVPKFSDLPNLPNITAVVYEVLRWRPAVIGGFAHATTREDEYHGYHIPVGAVVIPNHWGIHRDSAVYENPAESSPKRFMVDGVADGLKKLVAFGLGKRQGEFTHGFMSKPAGLDVHLSPREGKKEIIMKEWEAVGQRGRGLNNSFFLNHV